MVRGCHWRFSGGSGLSSLPRASPATAPLSSHTVGGVHFSKQRSTSTLAACSPDSPKCGYSPSGDPELPCLPSSRESPLFFYVRGGWEGKLAFSHPAVPGCASLLLLNGVRGRQPKQRFKLEATTPSSRQVIHIFLGKQQEHGRTQQHHQPRGSILLWNT